MAQVKLELLVEFLERELMLIAKCNNRSLI